MTTSNWRQILAPEIVDQIDAEMASKFMDGWNAHHRALSDWAKSAVPPDHAEEAGARMGADQSRRYPTKRAPRRYWHNLILKRVGEAGSMSTKALRERVSAEGEYDLGRSSYANALSALESEGAIVITEDDVVHRSERENADVLEAAAQADEKPSPFRLNAA